MRRFLTRFAALAALIMPLPAAAANGFEEVVQARILPGWTMPDGGQMAALQLTLAEGWKTYWRAPGDAGIPPRFDWSRSRNLDTVEITWPAPSVILQSGVRTIGYSDRLILPLKMTPETQGRAISLEGEVEVGVCLDVCIPVTLPLSQDLPTGQTSPDPRIAAALASTPYTAAEAGLRQISCQITPITDGLRLTARIDLPPAGGREVVVIETGNPAIWVAQSQAERTGDTLIAETEMFHVDGSDFVLNRAELRLTVLGRDRAVDILGCPAG